jgi:hypothetical protein
MIETYDALALKEPWLELILLGIKTLETRTKCLRKFGGEVVLVSSKQLDEVFWDHPFVGGLLDAEAKKRALQRLGGTAGLVTMSGFRPGIPDVEDGAARITIRYPGGVRQVSEITNVRRLVSVPTMRLRPDGVTLVPGAMQGIFKVPKDIVRLLEAA